MNFNSLCVIVKNDELERIEQHFFSDCLLSVDVDGFFIECQDGEFRFSCDAVISVSGIAG